MPDTSESGQCYPFIAFRFGSNSASSPPAAPFAFASFSSLSFSNRSSSSTTSMSNGNVSIAATPVSSPSPVRSEGSKCQGEDGSQEKRGDGRAPDSCMDEKMKTSPPNFLTSLVS